MQALVLPILMVVLTVLQTTLVPALAIGGTSPDLIFLLVVYLALRRGTTISLWTAFWGGLLQDIAGGNPLGFNALLLLVIAYVVNLFRRQLFTEHVTAQVLIMLVVTLIHQFLAFFWMNTLLDTGFGFQTWVVRALGSGVLNALLAPVLFRWWGPWLPGENVYRNLIGGTRSRSHVTRMKSAG